MSGWDESWKGQLHFEVGLGQTCSRLTLVAFGERYVTYGSPAGREDNHATSLDEFKDHLRNICALHDKKYRTYKEDNQNASVHRCAFVDAVTSSYQPMAAKYLEEIGFQKIGPFEKLKHEETTVTLWVMSAPDFIKAIGYERVK